MAVMISDASSQVQVARHSYFYFWMAVALAVTAFIGFLPTFWMPLSRGIPERIALISIHAIIFYSWMLFLIWQTWLAASGKIARHRDVGLIGVSLATAVIIFGVLTAVNGAQRAVAANHAQAGETFMVVPLASLFVFTFLVIAALVNVRRSEWHKRLMISATAVLLDAAIARIIIVYIVMGGNMPPFHGTVGVAGLPGPPPPVLGVLPSALICLLFIVAGMIYDRRILGKIHPAYWWAGGFALAVQLLKIPLSETALWHSFAHWLVSLAS